MSAFYRGASGVAPIYHYVCAVFPSGRCASFSPQSLRNPGHRSLGEQHGYGHMDADSGATGYSIRLSSTFSGSCTSCVVAALSSGMSYVDSSPSTPAGSLASLRCALRLVRSRWTTGIIRRLGCCGISLGCLPGCPYASGRGPGLLLSSPSHRSFRTSLVAREPGELIS